MRAGSLDREIAIETFAPGPPDEFGNVAEAWTAFATVRAQLVQASTDEYLAAYGETDKTVMIFRIRWLDGLTAVHRVIYSGRAFNIREVKEIGRRKGLELRCEALA